jgi:hypothetical protein
MDFDAAISIGGRSLLDGVMRLLQPALRVLDSALPLDVAGMPGTLLSIRSVTPSLLETPADADPSLGLRLEIVADALGSVPIVAQVSAGTLDLGLGTGTVTLPATGLPITIPAATGGSLGLPALSGALTPGTITDQTLAIDPMTGTLTLPAATGTIALPAGTGNVTGGRVTGQTLNTAAATGSLGLPALSGTLAMPEIIGQVSLTDPTSPIDLPIPAIVPVPLRARRLAITVDLSLIPDEHVDELSAFGLLLRAATPTVTVPLPAVEPLAADLEARLTAFLGSLPVPEVNLTTIATAIATAVQTAVTDTLTDTLSDLVARTGRLVQPTPDPASRCEIALLATVAHARIILDNDVTRLPVLQLGFAREDPPEEPEWPEFNPTAVVDVQVDIANAFLLDLLCCLLRKVPALSIHNGTARRIVRDDADPPEECCHFDAVTLNLWPLMLEGNFDICLVGNADSEKTIELRGTFRVDNLVDAELGVTATLGLDLSPKAALTGLRDISGAGLSVEPVMIELDDATEAAFVAALGSAALGTFIPFALTVAGLIEAIEGFVQGQVRSLISTILDPVRQLESPVAIPGGVFEAFGDLIPVSVTVDDLTSFGVLQTPTAPWTLGPVPPPPRLFLPRLPREPWWDPWVFGLDWDRVTAERVRDVATAISTVSKGVLLIPSGTTVLAKQLERFGVNNARVVSQRVSANKVLAAASIGIVEPGNTHPRTLRNGLPTIVLPGPSDAPRPPAGKAVRVLSKLEELPAAVHAWLNDRAEFEEARKHARWFADACKPEHQPPVIGARR